MKTEETEKTSPLTPETSYGVSLFHSGIEKAGPLPDSRLKGEEPTDEEEPLYSGGGGSSGESPDWRGPPDREGPSGEDEEGPPGGGPP